MASLHRAIALVAYSAAAVAGHFAPAFAAPATQPATQPAAAPKVEENKPERIKPEDPVLKSQRAQRDSAKQQFSHLKELGTMKREDLLQVSMEQGLLRLETTPLAKPESMRVNVEGSKARWVVSRQPAPNFPINGAAFARVDQGPTIVVQRVDTDVKDDDEIWSLYISSNNNFVTVMGTRVTGRISISQANNQLTVSIMDWQAPGRLQSTFTGRASSLQQFRTENPDIFRKHVVPLLAKLSDLTWLRPGPTDVYSAFTRIDADMKVMERLEALLPDLDSPAFPVRDTASAKLHSLGAPGVLAALRIDSSILTDEQRGRLGAFINQHRRRDFYDPALARKDPHFLIDALEYEDPAVRIQAKEQIEQLLGHPITLNDAEIDALNATLDDLRKQLTAAAAPATQPATKPAE